MQLQILNSNDITKVYLVYIAKNGIKKKEKVQVRYIDTKECYMSGALPVNFEKPPKKLVAELIAYTKDGIYSTKTRIMDTTVSGNEAMYVIEIPKKWDYTQLRGGSRKEVALPGCVKFEDGLSVEFTTYDLSTGGFSFISEKNIAVVYKRVNCYLSLKFPNDMIIGFPDSTLETEVKMVRVKENVQLFDTNGKMYAFRFVDLTPDETMILKNFLMRFY